MAQHIGALNEGHLHAALKQWYAQPGDQVEVLVDGFIIDIVRGDLLVEIQTGGFSPIKRKLQQLAARHPVRLVYPVAREKWILKVDADGQSLLSRRKSPKRGTYEDLFSVLVSFPRLLRHPNFHLEVLLIHEEEIRRHDSSRGWRRRGWVTVERRLLRVLELRRFETPRDMESFLPSELPETFMTSDLAAASGHPRRLAQKMAYCLREMEVIDQVGKSGNSLLYRRAQ